MAVQIGHLLLTDIYNKGIYTFLTNGAGLLVTFAFPYALDNIGWKTYMINGAWDFVQIAVIAWSWVETKGRTLEEIDEQLDGVQKQVILGVDPEHGVPSELSVEGAESDRAKKGEKMAVKTDIAE